MWRALRRGVAGLGAFVAGRRLAMAQGDAERASAPGESEEDSRGSLADLHLEREAEEIIADAQCPSCLREALRGPCGGKFLYLFRCSSTKADKEIEEGACADEWDAFAACYRSNLEWYEERHRQMEEEDEQRRQDGSGDRRDDGERAIGADVVVPEPSPAGTLDM
ncbi:GCK domain-containing protein [Plasmodiophora brassicae]|uniref:GCK domain-containing protein n=1 Tax=Plasmodiophora brassicae TaxID=37360 RepID=A0A0G4J2Y8_PLABS|nr:hypothetical protein PBRA_002283 [Plasmodiophora brassicae]SPQ98872.1 unnamed protein product [Plasmodiophora brassicae]